MPSGFERSAQGKDRSSAWGEAPLDDSQGIRNTSIPSSTSPSESLLPAVPFVYSSLLSIPPVVPWSTNPSLCTLLSPPSEHLISVTIQRRVSEGVTVFNRPHPVTFLGRPLYPSSPPRYLKSGISIRQEFQIENINVSRISKHRAFNYAEGCRS